MSSKTAFATLKRLWMIHQYSLPSYLRYAPPWWQDDVSAASQLLADIAAEHQRLADRIGNLIIRERGILATGQFPHRFSRLHDLSSSYLWPELVRDRETTVQAIEQIISELPRGSRAAALAQECLGVAKAQLDSLRETSPDRSQPS